MSGFRFVAGPERYSVGFFLFDGNVLARNTAFCWDLDDMKRAHDHRPRPESYVLHGEAKALYFKHRSGYYVGLASGIIKDIVHAVNPPPGKEYYRCFEAGGQHTARRDGSLLVVLHDPLS